MKTDFYLAKKVSDVYDNNKSDDPSEFLYLHLPVTPGIILIDEDHAIFKCPCGCGLDTQLWIYWSATRPKGTGYMWRALLDENGGVTFEPSVYSSGFACRSHYFIKEGKVEWVS